MQRFREFVQEHFLNLIGDDERKREHVAHVKHLLDKSYESIGGIHGSGFKDHDDMIKNLPFWKLKKHQGKVVAAGFYKDKGGRKLVAAATDGSEAGKHHMASMVKADLTQGRSYGEKSSKALSFIKRHVGADNLAKHVVPYEHVAAMHKDEPIRKPPADDAEVVRHPEYKDHFYQRQIGGSWHTKLMLGKPGNKIEKR